MSGLRPGAGEYPVVEPATGAALGMVGKASVDHRRCAAWQAAEVPREGAGFPTACEHRSFVAPPSTGSSGAANRGGPRLYIRESGSTATKAGFDFHLALTRRGHDEVHMRDFTDALERVVLGAERRS